jgi:hypothetical protein
MMITRLNLNPYERAQSLSNVLTRFLKLEAATLKGKLIPAQPTWNGFEAAAHVRALGI